MSASSGPSIVTNGLVFDYDMSNTNAFGTGKSFRGAPTTNLLTYSDSLNSGAWSPYCGNLSNVTFKTTDITAPDGSYNATRLIVDGSTSCGGGGAWGLLWGTGGLSSGTTYTCSLWMKADRTTGVTLAINDSSGTGVTVTTTWQRFTYTYTTGATDRGLQFIRSDSTSGIKIYVWGAQLEVGSFATPYVSTSSTSLSRTNTQALIDLTNNNTITASSLTYASDNTFSFNGSNSITFPNPLNQSQLSQVWTVQAWVNISHRASNIQTLISGLAAGVHLEYVQGYNALLYLNGGANDYYTYGYSGGFADQGWCLATFRFNNATGARTIWRNLTEIGNANGPNNTSTPEAQSATFTLGGSVLGYIGTTLIYNRYLTEQEVQQNFNARRSRYGI